MIYNKYCEIFEIEKNKEYTQTEIKKNISNWH